MRITLHLSGGLRAVLEQLPDQVNLEVKGPVSVRDIIIRAGINPLLVVVVTVDGNRGDKEQIIDHDAAIGLIGPMAGG